MPRHFSPPAIPRNIDPWLFNALTRLSTTTEQSAAGLAAIARGESPDGSGQTLTDLTNYLYMPGRHGGQTAYGATEDSGLLTLSSTKSTTKGTINLGSAGTTLIDEYNDRIGIKIGTPSAVLHILGEAASSTILVPSSDVTVGTWRNELSSIPLYTSINHGPTAIDDATFMASGGADTVEVHLTPISTPSGATSVIISYRAKVSAGTSNINMNLLEGVTVRASQSIASTTSFVTYTRSLSAGEIASITDWTNLRLSFSRSAGVVVTISEAWVTITGAGGGSAGFDAKTLVLKAASGQSANAFEAENSSGTSLISITAAGRLTVESGGTFRMVPGAAASTLMLGNSTGDASWGTINLLSAYHADTIAGSPTQGCLMVGTAALKWSKLAVGAAGKFLTVVGSDPAWASIAITDLPDAVKGWTDDGTVVRLTTSTDQVGIGTASPSASLGVVNVNNTTDVVQKITGKASQSGDLLEWLSSTPTVLGGVTAAGNLFAGDTAGIAGTPLYAKARAATDNILLLRATTSQSGDSIQLQDEANHAKLSMKTTTAETGLKITAPSAGFSRILFIPGGQCFVAWGTTGDFGPAKGSSDADKPCAGTRLSTYHDSTNPSFDNGYGQDADDAWVLVDPSTKYSIWTGDTTSAARARARWQPNGDLTNYGKITISKFTVGTTGLSASSPGLRLEETGAGSTYIELTSPSSVTASRTQTLLDVNGAVPVVGNAASLAAGKLLRVALTAQTADIASTNLTQTAKAGMYRVVYSLSTTTVDAAAGQVTLQVAYTNNRGSTGQSATALNLALGADVEGSFDLNLASGEISYLTTHSGSYGTAAYDLNIRVIYLG